MRKKSILHAFLVIGLAVLFAGFFQFTKHYPLLRNVNVFGEDPYDAVSSFGFLLALFASAISAFWAIQSRRDKQFTSGTVVVLSILVAIFSDLVALIRYRDQWIHIASGQFLAIITLGMLAIAVLVGTAIIRSSHIKLHTLSFNTTGILLAVSAFILFFYPTSLRRSMSGELETITIGMIIFFILVWSGMKNLFPKIKMSLQSKLHNLLWVIVIGVIAGIALFIPEALSEGMGFHFGIPIMLISIFVGFAGSGAVICYIFLSEYLGISK